MSLSEKLLASQTTREAVELGELGTIYIRQLTLAEMGALRRWFRDGAGDSIPDESVIAKTLATCCVDETGSPVFFREQLEALGKLPSPMADKLFRVANRLNHITAAAEEDVRKN